MFFSKKESSSVTTNPYHTSTNTTGEEKKEETVGLVIHFTPIAVYVYNVIDDVPEVDVEGVISLYDMDDNLIEISGTYVSLEVPKSKIRETKRKYGLQSTILPIIEIECKVN